MSKHTSIVFTSLMGLAGLAAAAHSVAESTVFNSGVTGTIPVRIETQDHQVKVVQLMQLQLSEQIAQVLGRNITMMLSNPRFGEVKSGNLPDKYNATMNSVPVLDQGRWGTCATFASTAGVDATLGLTGDASVSQLCNLELGKTLNNPPGANGGWDGSFGYIVLGQVQDYGYLPMTYQKVQGCGGLKAYPVNGGSNGVAMSKEDFEKTAQHSFTQANWKTIHAYNGSFKPLDPTEGAVALDKVKQAVARGDRVVFGTLLDQWAGQAGAVGKYNGVNNDTWLLTDQIKKDIEQGWPAGHEMVIYGYDDSACATYDNGQKQCGLLRLRNSWGEGAGSQGDYFMTYDYFKTMSIESYDLGQNL